MSGEATEYYVDERPLRERAPEGQEPVPLRGDCRLRLEEFLFGFVVCFFFFFAVFFVNQILLMAEDILSKRAPLKDVILLLIYAMPSVIAMSFPFASLVGALMAAGRLSSDNEMLAAMAAGIAPRRIFVPFLSSASPSRSCPSR